MAALVRIAAVPIVLMLTFASQFVARPLQPQIAIVQEVREQGTLTLTGTIDNKDWKAIVDTAINQPGVLKKLDITVREKDGTVHVVAEYKDGTGSGAIQFIRQIRDFLKSNKGVK